MNDQRAGRGENAATLTGIDCPAELLNHPRYRVEQVLGKGGMGTVFAARHLVMKRPVAVKVIADDFLMRPTMVTRFHREVEAAARLNHPNIVTAFDAEQAQNCHFLVMELVDGVSLDRVIRAKGPMPLGVACECARQAALGLQHAHERGMVHRDIKPQNLMLTRQGVVKILDFGLALLASEFRTGEALTETGMTMGTPDFMAPEQAEESRSADIRADIYSLGCTLYYLLSGQPPFPTGTTMQKLLAHVRKPVPPLSEFRHDVPDELMTVIHRMTAKEPDERIQSPTAVAAALTPYCQPIDFVADYVVDIGNENPTMAPLHRTSANQTAHTPTAAMDVKPVRSSPVDSDSTGLLRDKRLTGKKGQGRTKKRLRTKQSWSPWLVAGILAVILIFILGGLLGVALSRGWFSENPPVPKNDKTTPPVAAPGEGHVTVASRDLHVQIAIRRGTELLGTISPSSNPQLSLPVGTYELEVVGGGPEARGLRERLTIVAGERKVIEVRLEGIFVQDARTFRPPPGPPPDEFGRPRPPPP